MIHELTLWAVKRKAHTDNPDILISNTEMTAAVAYIYKDAGIPLCDNFDTPEALYENYMNESKDIDFSVLSEMSQRLNKVLKIYHVLPMVNENLDDLHKIAKMAYNDI